MNRIVGALLSGCLALSGLDCGWGIAGTLTGRDENRDISKRIRPEHDFEYLGAFRFPDERSSGTSWGWGGDGMTYDPEGDPDGPDDGHPGSLFAIGHRHKNYVSEISIPRPSLSRKIEDLPVARTLQPFTDVTGGIQIQRLTGRALADIELFGDRLYWVLFEYYLPKIDMQTFGWANPDFRNVQPRGPWRIGGFASAATSKYLFEIPREWADRYVSGHRIAAGRSRVVNRGSWGPALYAVEPWNADEPPPKGDRLESIELLKYPGKNTRVKGYSNADDWRDGAWITAGDNSAVVFAGMKAERSLDSGLQYYGQRGPHGCGSKGFHGEPYYGAMLFYDTADLAAVASGWMSPWKPQPYVTFQVENFLFKNRCRPILGGVAFDRARALLYVIELETDGPQRKPIVHAWKVKVASSAPDTAPPTPPAQMRIASHADGVLLRWKESSDDVGAVIYVVYRDDAPIAITRDASYRDRHGAGSSHRYQIESRDAVGNRSARSSVVSTGTDRKTSE